MTQVYAFSGLCSALTQLETLEIRDPRVTLFLCVTGVLLHVPSLKRVKLAMGSR